MSAINRTLFYDVINGQIVFNDWTMTNTTLGVMVEPLNMNRFNSDGTAFDPADPMSLITEMKEVDFNKLASQYPFADDDGCRLHGGNLNPRTGF